MKIRSNCRIKRTVRNEKGNYTVEAALLLPIIAILVIGLLFGILLSLQSSLTYITANQSSERMAHTWDNSYKNPVTGMFTLFEYDPLYWRWSDGSALSWFGLSADDVSDTVQYPVETRQEAAERLTRRKLSTGADLWPQAYRGKGAYEAAVLAKTVDVHAQVPFRAPQLLSLSWGDRLGGSSEEIITEPAEYIRNIELALAYLPVLLTKMEGDAIRNSLSRWIDKTEPVPTKDRLLSFRYHAEAVRYMQALVSGKPKRITTRETGKWRLIDALDKHGVAHQAYIGSKRVGKDITKQMQKDAELIRDGKVNGVVWHFFRRTGDKQSGPSASLRRQLQQHGIIVVVHS
jgi:Flp pilus assembly pilin Flp